MIFQTLNRQNKMSPAFNHNILLHWFPNLWEKTCTECRQEKVNVIEMTNVGSQTDYQSMDARGRNRRKCLTKHSLTKITNTDLYATYKNLQDSDTSRIRGV